MPKRKAGNDDPGERQGPVKTKVVLRNETRVWDADTHYRSLSFDFSANSTIRAHRTTYEGVKLCCYCGMFYTQSHLSTSRVDGDMCLPAVDKNMETCEVCGLPVTKSVNLKAAHKRDRLKLPNCDMIRSMELPEATWEPHPSFQSLVCPFCGLPGFTVQRLVQHLRELLPYTTFDAAVEQCSRRRKVIAKEKLSNLDTKPCGTCGHWLDPAIMDTHLCGIIREPVWTGMDTEMPDVCQPYPVFCDELPAPHGPAGVGGVFLGKEDIGRVPEKLLETSWHVPFATNLQFAKSSFEPKRILWLGNRIKSELRDEEVSDIHEADSKATTYDEAWAERVSKLPGEDKLRELKRELKHVVEIRNRQILREANITFEKFIPGKCPGYSWKHGHVACRSNEALDLGTVRLRRMVRNNKKTIEMSRQQCTECKREWSAVNSWLRYSKYDQQGERSCTSKGCSQALSTPLYCEDHHKKYMKKVFDNRIRKSRDQQRAQRKKQVKFKPLSRLLTKEEVSKIFTGLAGLRHPPWLAHADGKHWENAAASKDDDYQGPPVFGADTESEGTPFYGRDEKEKITPFEICILNGRGEAILHTPVNWGRTIADLVDGLDHGQISKVCQIYGVTDTSHQTTGMTPDEITDQLIKLGFNAPGAVLVEHSMSRFDWKAIALVVGENNMPVSLNTFDLLKLIGWTGPTNLQTLYYLIYPDSPINVKHHRALWDVVKMHIIEQCIFQGRVVPESEFADLIQACLAFNWRSNASLPRESPREHASPSEWEDESNEKLGDDDESDSETEEDDEDIDETE